MQTSRVKKVYHDITMATDLYTSWVPMTEGVWPVVTWLTSSLLRVAPDSRVSAALMKAWAEMWELD